MFGRWARALVSCLTLATLGVTDCKPVVIEDKSGTRACESHARCDSDAVCAFGLCHDACATSADCARGRCVITQSGSACLLDQEMGCVQHSDCPAPLLCGADGQCRNACQTNDNCLNGQLCSLTGECADANELDPTGNLEGAPRDPGGQSVGGWNNASGGAAAKGGMGAGGAAHTGSAGMASAGGKANFGKGGSGTGGLGGTAGGGPLPIGGAGGASGGGPGSKAGAGGGLPWGAAGSGGAAGAAGSEETGGGPTEPEGVLLTPAEGWLAGTSNTLSMQGAIFPYADPVATLSLISDFTGANACIKGTAPKVDLSCIPDPGSDCYGKYFGSGIGLYLNQPLDDTTDPPTALSPVAYDASLLKGFSFELTGNAVPGIRALRFGVFTADTEFCEINYNFKIGVNTVLFSEMHAACYGPAGTAQTAEAAQSTLIRIGWHVMTNPATAFDYDFCISNIRALLK